MNYSYPEEKRKKNEKIFKYSMYILILVTFVVCVLSIFQGIKLDEERLKKCLEDGGVAIYTYDDFGNRRDVHCKMKEN